MARPVSQIKLGFYPTPPAVVEHLCRVISDGRDPAHLEDYGPAVTVLDNFAGEGQIGVRIAEKLKGWPYLVELDKGRAEACTTRVRQYILSSPVELTIAGRVLNAPAESVQSAGGFSVWIFNPPYDDDAQSHGRLEMYLFKQTVGYAARPGTLCVLILPRKVVARQDFQREVYRHLDSLTTMAFPEPYYERFNQVIVLGYARQTPVLLQDIPSNFRGQWEMNYPKPNFPQGCPPYKLMNFEPVTEFASVLPNWETVLAQADSLGVRQGPLWPEFLRPRTGAGAFRPLMELDSGKAALLTAAGMANSTLIGQAVLKGATRTYIVSSSDTKQGQGGAVYPQVKERETYAQTLTLFDLTTGELTVLDSQKTAAEYSAFILEHADELIGNIRAKYPPVFNGDTRRWDPLLDRLCSPKVLPGLPPGLLPKQRQVAAAIALGFQKIGGTFFGIGEQGTGKTTTTIAAILLANAGRIARNLPVKVVVMIPGHLVHKWAREAEAVGANFKVHAVIIGQERPNRGGRFNKPDRFPLLDVRKAMAEPGITFLILSKETGKNGSPWAPRSGKHTRLHRQHEIEQTVSGPVMKAVTKQQAVLTCPRCGAPVVDEEGYPIFELPRKQRWTCQAKLTTSDWIPATDKVPAHFRQEVCGAPLYTHGEAGGSYDAFETYAQAFHSHDWGAFPPRTPEPGKRALPVGFRRAAVAEYLSQHYGDRYDLILDEVHQYKGHDSDQGYASTDLVSGARHVIMATGTPYGGKASTIFDLLYKAIPWFRKLYGYSEVDKFVSHFGLIETTWTGPEAVELHDSTLGYSRGSDWRMSVKEIPGAHPVMASFLLPYAGFMRLSEMGVKLPPYTEERLPVEFPEPVATQVVQSLSTLYHAACNQDAQGFSAYLQAGNGWPDLPNAESFTFKDKSHGYLPKLVMPGEVEWPKVRTVTDMVVSENAVGRKSILYLDQVHRRDTTELYVQSLRARGLKPFVLRSSTPGDEREELINQATNAGTDVLICNGSLVETGLDLVYFSTILRLQPITSFYKENQQDRRIWRLGQTQPCRIIWVYYAFTGSVQALTVALMAKKLRAALLMNGDLAEGLAATEDNDDNFLQALMKQLREAEAPQFDDVPIAGVALPAWLPAWNFTFADWQARAHTIAAHAKGRAYLRPGAKPVLFPRSASDEQIIAWEYRREVLRARDDGMSLPGHALAMLDTLPLLPGEKPSVRPATRVELPIPLGETAPAPAGVSEPIPLSEHYTLRSLGNGTLSLKNGADLPPARVIWLGGDRLSGPAPAVAAIRAHFARDLANNKPTKKWEATV